MSDSKMWVYVYEHDHDCKRKGVRFEVHRPEINGAVEVPIVMCSEWNEELRLVARTEVASTEGWMQKKTGTGM